MKTKFLFEELLTLVKSLAPESIGKLKQGHSKSTIESTIEIKPIPNSLAVIYFCADGDDISEFIPFYNLIPLNEINDKINIFRQVRNEIINADKSTKDGHEYLYWETDMIPFLDNHCGSKILVRSLSEDESVWKMSKYDPTIKINSSIDKFLMSTIEFYRQGAYYQELDDDDELDWTTDWDLAKNIVKQIDPEIENYSPP